MRDAALVAVTSRSFSRHPILRAELLCGYENVRFNDAGTALNGDDLAAFLEGCEKAIVALERIDDRLLARLPLLRVISKVGVGLDSIDLAAAERRGVRVAWRSGTNSRSVAELVVAFAIALLRHLPRVTRELREGAWSQPTGSILTGKTVGIVGFGNVGADLARLLAAFECSILAHDLRQQQVEGVTWLPVDDLLAEADIVSLHLALDDSTRGLLDRRRLSLLRPSAILINTSRGGLVDEAALAEMLREQRLAGAAFDVFATEPPGDIELLRLPNFLGTPHIGGSTEEAILAMGRAAIAGLEDERNRDDRVDL